MFNFVRCYLAVLNECLWHCNWQGNSHGTPNVERGISKRERKTIISWIFHCSSFYIISVTAFENDWIYYQDPFYRFQCIPFGPKCKPIANLWVNSEWGKRLCGNCIYNDVPAPPMPDGQRPKRKMVKYKAANKWKQILLLSLRMPKLLCQQLLPSSSPRANFESSSFITLSTFNSESNGLFRKENDSAEGTRSCYRINLPSSGQCLDGLWYSNE